MAMVIARQPPLTLGENCYSQSARMRSWPAAIFFTVIDLPDEQRRACSVA
ncbi:hypothetical protein ACQR1I_22395 [Bradyrhizobium sp. HKCCYLS2038]